MTDHTPTDAQLRDNLDDILYPMKAVSIEHYNTAMEMAEALINDAVREAEIKGRNYAWSQVLHYQDVPLELKEHIRGRIRASTLNNDKDSKDKEETDENSTI